MKKRVLVLYEGYTELNFVTQVLAPDYQETIIFEGRLLRGGHNASGGHAKGGVRSYGALCAELTRTASDVTPDGVYLTTMFDLYGLPTDYPGYSTIASLTDPWQKVAILEAELESDWRQRFAVGYKFVPYIQLHEFEALLFADIKQLDWEFIEPTDTSKIQSLVALAANFSSPEEINQGVTTAPSKRIIRTFPRYEKDKPDIAVTIAQKIGIAIMRRKCPHFNDWLSRLEAL